MNKRVNFKDLQKFLSDASIALPETVSPRHVEAIKRMIVDKGVLESTAAFDKWAERHHVQVSWISIRSVINGKSYKKDRDFPLSFFLFSSNHDSRVFSPYARYLCRFPSNVLVQPKW